jgi:hypothetical protein
MRRIIIGIIVLIFTPAISFGQVFDRRSHRYNRRSKVGVAPLCFAAALTVYPAYYADQMAEAISMPYGHCWGSPGLRLFF